MKKEITLSSYEDIVGIRTIEELGLLAEKVKGKKAKMVNSTAVGGGVAEILARLVPLMNELGVDTKWEVIKGSEEFFDVTKTFHNALHGDKVEITPQMFDLYRRYIAINASEMSFDEDIILIHDPQPAGLIKCKEKGRGKWVWRCHIDLSNPHRGVWEFLEGYVKEYDASLFSSPAFAQILPIPQYLVYPCIDPLSTKNKDLPPEVISRVLGKYGIDKERPIITQISRFDRLKDPVGVVEAYKLVKKRTDCQLVIAGGGAADDPEAELVLTTVREKGKDDPDIHILVLPPFSDIEINALQRASTIILQKSLREGFGLTVTEALWKGKPVIGSAVGGIPLQIKHNLTGILVHSIEGAAFQIRYLLNNPEYAARLGQYGREYVREKFLLTRLMRSYLLLFIALDHLGEKVIEL